MKQLQLTGQERAFIRAAMKEWNHNRIDSKPTKEDQEAAERDFVSTSVRKIREKLDKNRA